MNPIEKDALIKYQNVISIWIQWDKSFWDSFNMYVLFMGLLFAGYTQIIKVNKFIAIVLCVTSALISRIWTYILHRKLANILHAQETDEELEKIFFGTIPGCFTRTHEKSKSNIFYNFEPAMFEKRIKFSNIRSGKLVAYNIPILLMIIWIILTISTLFFIT